MKNIHWVQCSARLGQKQQGQPQEQPTILLTLFQLDKSSEKIAALVKILSGVSS